MKDWRFGRTGTGPAHLKRVAGVVGVLMLVFWGTSAVAQTPKGMISRLSVAVQKADTIAELWGVAVMDLDRGDVVFQAGSDAPLNLASNGKLPTTVAALEYFGPDATLETVIRGKLGPDGVVEGDLVVVGGGDPSMTMDTLKHLVAQVKKAGVARVDGRVCVDDSLFDGEHLPPAFEQKYTDSAYRASIGAFAVDYSAFSVGFRPDTILGNPARITISPAGANVVVDNSAKTVTGKLEKLLVKIGPEGDYTKVTVTGTIGIKNKGGAVRKRIDDPALLAIGVFRNLLETAGIDVESDEICRAKATETMELLVTYTSPPMAKLVADVNLHSNNMMAETLLKQIGVRVHGSPGTWAAGQKAVEDLLIQAGLNQGEFHYQNGSGLYEADFIKAVDMTRFLRWVHGQTYQKEFLNSLPVAGKSGTLRGRMGGTAAALRVMAKTGTMDHVITLTGYVQAESGRWYTFAFLFNGTKAAHGVVRGLIDRMCAIVAEFG